MPRLFTQLGEGDFVKLGDLVDTEPMRRKGKKRVAPHQLDDCENPFRCPVHRRNNEAAKRIRAAREERDAQQRESAKAAMRKIAAAPIPGTHAYANSRGTR